MPTLQLCLETLSFLSQYRSLQGAPTWGLSLCEWVFPGRCVGAGEEGF